MSDCTIIVEDAYSVDTGSARSVFQGLVDFNLRALGEGNHRPIAVYATANDEVIGGLLGWTRWGWLHVESVWITESRRKHGIGAQLMKAAEDEARQRGCRHAHLETAELQAPEFYKKLGYEVFGVLDGFGPGKLYFFQKSL